MAVVHRPVRTPPPAVAATTVQLPRPPAMPSPVASRSTWLQPALPVLGSTGSLLFMLANPRPVFVLAGSFVAAGTIVVGVGMFWQQRANVRRRLMYERQAYLRYLGRVRSQLRDSAERQRDAAAWAHPAPGHLWSVVRMPGRLWERRRSDDDFLTVRVGLGPARPLAGATLDHDDDPMRELDGVSESAARKLVASSSAVGGMPTTLALDRLGVLAVRGDRPGTTGLARAAVAQIAAFHAPDDVRLAAVVTPDHLADWDWLKWLPHAQGLVFDEPGRAARALGAALDARRSGSEHDALGGAHLVVLVDGWTHDPVLEELLVHPPGAGATVLHLHERGSDGPGDADVQLQVDADGSLRTIPGPAAPGVADDLGPAQAEALARHLAPIRLSADTAADALERTVSLDELLGVGDLAAIDVDRAWGHRSVRDQLAVPFAVGADGEPVTLDLKESAYGGMGPHGLLIGATGSGKSELLRTLVAGLAARHPPDELAFILVDFKGGAAFAELARLPHVAGLITNLADDLGLIDRTHAALHGEQRRRQELLHRAGNLPSAREYQKRRATDPSMEPLPSLVVIIDEFSELLATRPEMLDVFVSMGRLGRSLGIHLLLSSQRLEEGRLRGLDSHLRYRIGLRTFSAAESRSVLGVPDAYTLPAMPGAGFLKVDTDVFTRFRAATVSVPHDPAGAGARSAAPTPMAVEPFAAVPPPAPRRAEEAKPFDGGDDGDDGEPAATVVDLLVEQLAAAARPVHQVWLPPLPTAIALDDLVAGVEPRGRLSVPVGVADHPDRQAQDVLRVELHGANGNVAIVGGPRSGKTTLVQTLVASAALTRSPADVELQIVDFGGGGLAALAELPHVGTVAGRTDGDLVRRTLTHVHEQLRIREESPGADPDLCLVIDGWPAVRAEYEGVEPLVAEIGGRGLGLGVHLIVTANRWLDIRPVVKDTLGTRLELRLVDPGDSDVGRRVAETVPADVPGRGLTRDGTLFQAALPWLGEAADGDDALVRIVAEAQRRWPGRGAEPVKVLPLLVPADALPAGGDGGAGRGGGDGRADGGPLTIGIGEPDLGPVTLDLGGAAPHLLVLGETESGKTSALRLLLRQLYATRTPAQAQIVVVDYRRSLLDAVDPTWVCSYLATASAAATELGKLREGLARRSPPADVSIEALRNRSWWDGPEIWVLCDDYDLVAGAAGSPLHALGDLLPVGRDVGLHVVVARRSGSLARSLHEPVVQRILELGSPVLLLSGDPAEGTVTGGVRMRGLPPGRAVLVRRRQAPTLVQLGWSDPDAPAPATEVRPKRRPARVNGTARTNGHAEPATKAKATTTTTKRR